MTSEVKKQIRAKGILKCIIGLIMLVIMPLVNFIGLTAKFIGGICVIVGAVIKVFEIFSQHDKTKQVFLKERTEKFIHFGTIAFLGGLVMTIPYLAAVIVIMEGAYNAIRMEDKYNCVEFLDKAGKLLAKFISNFKNIEADKPKNNKQDKEENIIDAKIIEEKPTKKTEVKKKAKS